MDNLSYAPWLKFRAALTRNNKSRQFNWFTMSAGSLSHLTMNRMHVLYNVSNWPHKLFHCTHRISYQSVIFSWLLSILALFNLNWGTKIKWNIQFQYLPSSNKRNAPLHRTNPRQSTIRKHFRFSLFCISIPASSVMEIPCKPIAPFWASVFYSHQPHPHARILISDQSGLETINYSSAEWVLRIQ